MPELLIDSEYLRTRCSLDEATLASLMCERRSLAAHNDMGMERVMRDAVFTEIGRAIVTRCART